MLNKINLILLPILTLLYLIVNTLLLYTNNYCDTKGCGLTKTLLNIDQIYLYILAIFSVSILIIFGILILKTKNQIYNNFFNVLLFILTISETIFVSYLYFKTNSFCFICLGFYSLLLSNFIINNIINKSYLHLFIIPSIIVALSFIKLDKQINVKPFKNNTLIVSQNCENCKIVEKYFYDKNIKINLVNYEDYVDTLNILNINDLPVLFINKNNKINFLYKEEIFKN